MLILHFQPPIEIKAKTQVVTAKSSKVRAGVMFPRLLGPAESKLSSAQLCATFDNVIVKQVSYLNLSTVIHCHTNKSTNTLSYSHRV